MTSSDRPLTRPRLRHAILVSTIGVLIGSTFLATKIALGAIGPLTIVAGRIVIAAAVVGGFVASRGIGRPRGGKTWGLLCLIGLLNTAVPYFLTTWAIQYIETGTVAILGGTGPLIGLALSHALTRDDRLTAAKLVGMIMAFIGVLLAVGTGPAGHVSRHLLASLAAVGMAGSHSTGGVLARRVAHVAPDTVTAVVLACGVVVMLPIALVLERPWTLVPGRDHLLAMAYLGIMSTGVPYALRFRLIRDVGYTFTSFSGYLVPVAGILLGAAFLGEAVAWSTVLALGLVLAGMWVSRARPMRRAVTDTA